MKKLIALIFIVLFGFISWKCWEYYQTTYVGQNYYAVIKAPLPEETDIKDMDGKVMGKGYKYTVDAFNKTGDKRQLNLEVITTGDYANGSAFPGGTILLLNASEKRIIKQQVISKEQVPDNLKSKLGLS